MTSHLINTHNLLPVAFPHREVARLRDTFLGRHSITLDSGPLVCAAALATPQAIENDDLPRRAARHGEKIRHAMRAALTGTRGFVEVWAKAAAWA